MQDLRTLFHVCDQARSTHKCFGRLLRKSCTLRTIQLKRFRSRQEKQRRRSRRSLWEKHSHLLFLGVDAARIWCCFTWYSLICPKTLPQVTCPSLFLRHHQQRERRLQARDHFMLLCIELRGNQLAVLWPMVLRALQKVVLIPPSVSGT